jgi:hypothetical protein
MRSERPRTGSSSKTVWIVLGIVGGLLLLVCGGCIIGGFFIWKSPLGQKVQAATGAQLAAQDFFQRLGSGNVETAYNATSKGFQSRQSLAQFRAFVDRNPGLKSAQNPTFQVDANSMTETSSKFQVIIPTTSGATLNGTLRMIKEGDQWKVDDFTIP